MSEKVFSGSPAVVDFSREDSMRAGFGRGLVLAARANEKVVALAADLRDSVGFGDFAREFPARFVEIGIAEQNLVTVASGMAHLGQIPFAASYAAFSPGRNYEQIRTTIALNNQNVKVIGTHAGVNVGPDGATHQMLEDIALMRVLPRMVVIAPADATEAEQVAQVIAQDSRPTYVRLAREKSPTIFDENHEFEIGKAYVLRAGTDITLLATGTMTAQCLAAAEILARQNIDAEVVHVPTIKPLDNATILKSIAKTRAAISVEEHEIAGGFGGAIAELIAENLHQIDFLSREKFAKTDLQTVKFKRIGIHDEFGQSGTAAELLKHYHLTPEHIAHVVHIITRAGGGISRDPAADFKIFYAAYGANREPEMLRHVIGADAKILENNCWIQDYELCIQTYNEIPEIRFNGSEYQPKTNLDKSWRGKTRDFQTYIIRPKMGARVAVRLYEITGLQHELIRNWENWFKPILVEVRTPDGRTIVAKTESLWEDQSASRAVDGENYASYLLDPTDMWRVADAARAEF